jgi:hypothetical protein
VRLCENGVNLNRDLNRTKYQHLRRIFVPGGAFSGLGWYLFDDNDVPVGGPLTSRDKAMATLKSKLEKKKKHR